MPKPDNTPRTLLTYMYRDGANFKFHKTIIISGILKMEDLTPYLHDWTQFMPQAVGLECLVPKDLNEDDHEWHELYHMEITEQEGPAVCSAEDLKSKFIENHKDNWESAYARYQFPDDPATYGVRRYRP